MLSKNTKFYSLIVIAADFFTLLLAFALAYFARVSLDERNLLTARDDSAYFYAVAAIVPAWILLLSFLGLYNSATYSRRLVEWGKIAVGSFIGILLVIGWEYVANERIFPARLVTVYVLIGSFFLLVLEREFLRLGRSILFRLGKGISRVLIVGNSEATADIARRLADTGRSGYKIVAIAGPQRLVPVHLRAKHFPTVESALKQVDNLRINTIIQTDLYDSTTRNQQILSAAQSRHISYSFIPGEPEFYAGKNNVDVFLGYPIINVSQTPLIGWGAIAKRIFDVIIASLLIIILSPFMLLVIILQQIFNPGSVLFRHERLTQYSKPFMMYKFRSMKQQYCGHNAAEIFKEMGREDLVQEYQRTYKVKNDPRITLFGKFIRATSIDELPQLFNVVKGDLSLVGPRPVPKYELDEKYTKKHGALLLSVKSGITGLWQVSGRDDLTTEQRIQLELYYVQNWSFWMDIKILFKTIGAVIRRSGAS